MPSTEQIYDMKYEKAHREYRAKYDNTYEVTVVLRDCTVTFIVKADESIKANTENILREKGISRKNAIDIANTLWSLTMLNGKQTHSWFESTMAYYAKYRP